MMPSLDGISDAVIVDDGHLARLASNVSETTCAVLAGLETCAFQLIFAPGAPLI
jgi:hypothetical protein